MVTTGEQETTQPQRFSTDDAVGSGEEQAGRSEQREELHVMDTERGGTKRWLPVLPSAGAKVTGRAAHWERGSAFWESSRARGPFSCLGDYVSTTFFFFNKVPSIVPLGKCLRTRPECPALTCARGRHILSRPLTHFSMPGDRNPTAQTQGPRDN